MTVWSQWPHGLYFSGSVLLSRAQIEYIVFTHTHAHVCIHTASSLHFIHSATDCQKHCNYLDAKVGGFVYIWSILENKNEIYVLVLFYK